MLKHWQEKLVKAVGETFTQEGASSSPTLAAYQAYFDCYPLASLLPYEAYDEESGLFVNKTSVGFSLEAAPLTGLSDSSLTILASVLADHVPEGVSLQVLLWASPKIGDALHAWSRARQTSGDIYKHLAKARVGYLQQGAYQSLFKDSAYLIRDFQIFISVSLPKGSKHANVRELSHLQTRLLQALRAISVAVCPMGIERFMSVLSDLINPTFATQAERRPWDKRIPLAQQLAHAENQLLIHEECLHMGRGKDKMAITCFSVRDYPTHWSAWQMQDLIGDLYRESLQVPCPFLLQLALFVPPADPLAAKAHFKRIRADQQAHSPLARFIPSLKEHYHDWSFACDRLNQGDRLIEACFQVVLYSKIQESQTAEMALKHLFTAKGWKLQKDTFLSVQSWLSLLPFTWGEGMATDLRRFGRLRLLPSLTATHLLPLQGEWKGMDNPRLLLTGRRGQLLGWDNFANAEGNYNVAVVGKSGSGKSVFMQEILLSLLGSGGKVWVIDVGRSFAKTCALLNGEFLEFTPTSQVCLNPFSFIADFNEALTLLKPMLATMAKPTSVISDHESALLEQALKAAWEKEGQKASITHVATVLAAHADPRAHDLSVCLFPYTAQGMYGRFFEGRCTLESHKPLFVLELEELKGKKDLQAVVLMALMYQVTEAMYRGDRTQPLACIIDEAWDLLRGEQAGAFVETGCRRARKYNGAFITGTQSINDYYKTPAAQAAIENSDWVCLLSQKPESIEALKARKRLILDAYREHLLKSLKTVQGQYAEILLYGPPGVAVGRLLLDPFTRILYSSKGDEYAAVQRLQQQGYTLIEAIAAVAAQGKPCA